MNAEEMRRNAAHCLNLAGKTADETQRLRFLRAASAWRALAKNKDLLDYALLPNDPSADSSAHQKVA